MKRIYDLDRDGKLGARELEPARAYLKILATRQIALTLDGKKLPLEQVDATFLGLDEPADTGSDLHASFTLETKVSFARGGHVLVVSDRDKDQAVQVPIAVDTTGGIAFSGGTSRRATLSKDAPALALSFSAP